MSELLFDGYAENSDGVVRIEIRKDGNFYDVWQADDIRDDIENKKDFVYEYGRKLYYTLNEYKLDEYITIDDIWTDGDEDS